MVVQPQVADESVEVAMALASVVVVVPYVAPPHHHLTHHLLTLPMLQIPRIIHLAHPVEVALGLHLWF
jgi:hypothetical protein